MILEEITGSPGGERTLCPPLKINGRVRAGCLSNITQNTH
jgi:hypothetical protein